MRSVLIGVHCDDPRNGKNRQAELGWLQGDPQPDGTLLWRFSGPRKQRAGYLDPKKSQNENKAARQAGRRLAPEVSTGKPAFDKSGMLHTLPCPLCPRSLEVRDETLQALGGHLSAQNLPSVSLRLLETVAAKLRSDQ